MATFYKFVFIFLFAILDFSTIVHGSHILFLHTCTSYSHRVSSWPLVEGLLAQGHQITFIGPYGFRTEKQSANLTDIVPKRLNAFMNEVINSNFDVTHRASGLTPKFVMVYDYICYEACSELLQSEEMQDWLKGSPKIDLIYADTVPECSYGLASKFKAKHALILPITFISKYFDAYGVPPETSTIPDWDVTFYPPLTFLGRAVGAIIPLVWRLSQIIYYPWYASLFRKYLDLDQVPRLDDIQANTSLVLINGDFIEDYPRSFPPNVVKVGGLHVKARNGFANKPLDKELEAFVSKSDENGKLISEGFIYISFGTVAKGPNLPLKIRNTIFSTIESFPNLNFIWRWDGPNPQNYPKNLLLQKWVEQEDLLGHPRIKGFITQAGRPSMMEAFYNGVPTITFPILAEQDFNAHRFETLGTSVNLEIGDITEDNLKTAISKIVTDTRYARKTKDLANFAKDTQFSPLVTAVWWTEFLLRNTQESLSLLRPLSQSIFWFQRRDLDVWIFYGFITTIFLKMGWFIVLILWKKMFPEKLKTPSVQKVKCS